LPACSPVGFDTVAGPVVERRKVRRGSVLPNSEITLIQFRPGRQFDFAGEVKSAGINVGFRVRTRLCVRGGENRLQNDLVALHFTQWKNWRVTTTERYETAFPRGFFGQTPETVIGFRNYWKTKGPRKKGIPFDCFFFLNKNLKPARRVP